MIKEYRTISEVSGPLMLVKNVEGVTYDELGEIELPKRRTPPAARYWRSTAPDALVQLFDSSAGINLARKQGSLPGSSALQLAVSEDMLGRVFDGMGTSHRRRPGHSPGRK